MLGAEVVSHDSTDAHLVVEHILLVGGDASYRQPATLAAHLHRLAHTQRQPTQPTLRQTQRQSIVGAKLRPSTMSTSSLRR